MLSSLAAAAKAYTGDKEQMDPFDFLNYMPHGYSNEEGGNKSVTKDTEENLKDVVPPKGSWGFRDENVVSNCLLYFVTKSKNS